MYYLSCLVLSCNILNPSKLIWQVFFKYFFEFIFLLYHNFIFLNIIFLKLIDIFILEIYYVKIKFCKKISPPFGRLRKYFTQTIYFWFLLFWLSLLFLLFFWFSVPWFLLFLVSFFEPSVFLSSASFPGTFTFSSSGSS